MEDALKLEQDGEIARLTIDRPEKGNMLTLEMLDYLSALIIDAGCDPDIKAISLTSVGDDFCLGRDPDGAPEKAPKMESRCKLSRRLSSDFVTQSAVPKYQ